MSTSIDERIVAMRFNNSQFESRIKQTMASLLGFKKSLDLSGSAKSLDDLSAAGNRFSLSGLSSGVESVSGKFLALATVGITALTNITNKAIDAGARIVKSLTLEPVMAGFAEYELKMGSIQTILSNTQKQGTTLDQVTASLESLNEYADKTIYNFGDMTKNIGLFTNAGIGIEDATAMIKGFSNEAAASGTSAEGAAGAAYQLSQALSSGTIRLMDWRSLTNVGMGNKNMQSGIIEIAQAMGEFEGTTITATDAAADFNGSLEKNWLSADVMQNYLKIQAGELSVEQMKALNLTDAQITAFQKQASISQDAATKVRTWTQLLGTLQEGVGSSWATTFDLLIGDFDQATSMWTAVNDTLGPMIGAAGEARNAMLQAWADLGGRDIAIEGIKNAFNALMAIVKPIKEAFREVFPATTGTDLLRITQAITDFTKKLIISEETAGKVKRIFAGVFAIFQIGEMVVRRILQVFGAVFTELAGGSGEVLDFAASIGDMLVKFRDMIWAGGAINTFFDGFTALLVGGISAIKEFASYIVGLFGGDETATGGDAVEASIERVQTRLEPLKGLIDAVKTAFGYLGGAFKSVFTFFTPMATAIGDFFGTLGTNIQESLADMDFNQILDMINTGLFAGLILIIKKFLGGGLNVDVGGGMLETIRGAFDGLTGTLSAMQAQLKAGTLLKIAGAIALLVVSVIALSMIDSAKLTTALAAMTVMFTQLLVAMAIMAKVSASAGFIKMPLVAVAMGILAVAILILVAAVKLLSTMNWEELAKGLSAVAVLLGLVAGAAKLMSMNSGGLISAGLGMMAVAVAIRILVSSVKEFAGMPWADLAKGLAGVAATLLALGLFTRLLAAGKAGIAQSAGLILLAVALKVIASAVGDFAAFSWEELGKGMAAMAVALLLVAGAIKLIPPTILVTAAGLVVFAAAMVILAGVLETFGGMTWEEIAKGMVTLAGSLVIIAGAMYLMTGALPGALALIVVAGALTLLVPVLTTLGAMTWETILTGLGALAAMFLVLGVAGLVLTPVVPTLLGLGVAIMLIGAGTALAGVGIMALSVGLTALSVSGGAAALGLTAMVSAIINLIPMALIALANGIIAFATVIGNAAPTFVVAMVQLITALLTAIDTVAPLIINTLINLIFLLLNTLLINVPKFLVMGLKLIKALLDGIANNIGGIVASALSIITNLINGIAAGIPGLIQAGANLILTFITSLTTAINNNSAAMGKAGGDLAVAIVTGMVNGITAGLTSVVTAAKNLAKSALDSAKNFLGIKSPSREFAKIGAYSTEGMANGLTKTSNLVAKASEGVAATALNTLKKSMANIGSVISSDMDLTPTIRPILDLSDIRKGASSIDGMLSTTAVNPGSSYNRAADIAVENRSSQRAREESETIVAERTPGFTFIQNNNSPKALSHAEIYRNTKSQLSVAKGALRTNA